VTYAIFLIENGDIVADYDSVDDARAALHEYVVDNPGVLDRVGLVEFADDGQPIGDFKPARELERQPA
jgi:hypothetical protein